MTEEKELEATYGPAAPHSEHKRGEHITYTSAEGLRRSGEIVWVQAAFQDIPMKYIVAPDAPGAFLDFVLPADVITQEEQEPAMHDCPYCQGKHYEVNQCPLKPK